jgi:hypothetical protein
MSNHPTPTTNATMEEKLRTLFQDQALRNAERRKNASTFSQFAGSEAAQDAGRYAAVNKATVTGSAPVPEYPRQPDGSFSNQAAVVGPEESLGFDINEVPIVGEDFEVEASLKSLSEAVVDPEGPSAAVERSAARGDATPTETSSSNFPPAPSQEPVASPNPILKGSRK